MATATIIGDGPAGLSAALFLAKNGVETRVFGQDETWMHKAMVLNYLGVEPMTGTAFQLRARKQVSDLGATLSIEQVSRAEVVAGGFEVTTEHGERVVSDYLVLAAGPKTPLAGQLGVTLDANGFAAADRNGRTNVAKLYVAGWSTRPDKIQAIISAGDGAACALDILSAEKGKDFHDFDVPPEA